MIQPEFSRDALRARMRSAARACMARRLGAALVLLAVAALPHRAASAEESGGPATGRRPAAAPSPRTLEPALANAPNVVIVLLDDVGFGAAETFGGPIPTPTLDRLAEQGLRYNRFHTTGICSPTRASLLTGRNPHAVGVGAVLNSASNHPGKLGILSDDAKTLPQVLGEWGYATGAFGKWHLTPDWETSPAGPFDRWPTGKGFDHFYGFLGGETHQFEPTLYEGTQPVVRPPGEDYHVSEDLAERAAAWLKTQHSIRPERPFFVYLATGATHAPIHAPERSIRRFRGRFEHGWDEQRRRTFEKQKVIGVVPADAELTPRPAALPAWDSLSADERRVSSRLMEVSAGFLNHADEQVGVVVRALEEIGELDDTIFVYIVGDNGASAEGGVFGSWNYFAGIHGIPEDIPRDLGRLDEMGGPSSYPHYPAGWAWSLNAPFQWAKTIASHLGATRNPLVIHWPKGFGTPGAVRSQFAHVNDIMPTILDAIARTQPKPLVGAQGLAFDGTSLVDSFRDADAESLHRTQYFEVFGHRAIYHDGWMASAFRGRAPWRVLDPITRPLEEDQWELYDLEHDFSQARDLAAAEPERLRQLQALFEAEAARNSLLPIGNDIPGDGLPKLHQDRRRFVYGEGAIGIPESGAPPIPNRSYEIRAELEIPSEETSGVIVTEGGGVAGWALYLDSKRRPVYTYNFFDVERMTITGSEPLPLGPVVLRYVFDAEPGIGKGGRGRLYVGRKRVGEARIGATAPRFFSIDETFDVGFDTGSAAGDYPPGSPFTGTIRKVEVEID